MEVRGVQQTRKNAGLHVSDRIIPWLNWDDTKPLDVERRKAVKKHEDYVKEQTLATKIIHDDPSKKQGVYHEVVGTGEGSWKLGVGEEVACAC